MEIVNKRTHHLKKAVRTRWITKIINKNPQGFEKQEGAIKIIIQEEVLHKPIDDLKDLLERINTHNNNLYICALLTYGCLLRPHHEIRLLRWGDFSDDLSYITLSGSRVKSKRNRVVPVPEYVRKELIIGDRNHNLFGG